MQVDYILGDKKISLELNGETFVGDNKILLLQDENLIENTTWSEIGFTIQSFLTDKEFHKIQVGIEKMIALLVQETTNKEIIDFSLSKYHEFVNDEVHLKIVQKIQSGWPVTNFPLDFSILNHRISQIVGINVSSKAKHVDSDNFFLRIVRPQNFQDNNPPHRDVWLDRLRDAVNIYVPICGSTPNSSLGLVPGSHLLKECDLERTAEGAILNGTKYSVPCVVKINKEVPKLIRPNPKDNEVLLFSPYIVHGGGYNFNTDETRISLEVRFWKKKLI